MKNEKNSNKLNTLKLETYSRGSVSLCQAKDNKTLTRRDTEIYLVPKNNSLYVYVETLIDLILIISFASYFCNV